MPTAYRMLYPEQGTPHAITVGIPVTGWDELRKILDCAIVEIITLPDVQNGQWVLAVPYKPQDKLVNGAASLIVGYRELRGAAVMLRKDDLKL